MPKAAPDLTGKVYGRLTAVKKSEERLQGKTSWLCQCACGTQIVIRASSLQAGDSTSCGCHRLEMSLKNIAKAAKVRQLDIAGERFGKLVALSPTEGREQGSVVWRCRCDCGNFKESPVIYLQQGVVKSCGCLRGMPSEEKAPSYDRPADYGIWSHMLRRCYSTTHRSYKDYGARGITVCDRWRFGEDGKSAFECFTADMGPRPSPEYSINRRDNNAGYSRKNCHWATKIEQASNTRRNVFLVYGAERITRADAISRGLMTQTKFKYYRDKGLSPQEAFDTILALER